MTPAPHDVTQVDVDAHRQVVVVCACSKRFEGRTRAQADAKHLEHQHIEENRALLARGDEHESEGAEDGR